MESKHIVSSYDDDLDLLKSKLLEMSREADDQISKANQALLNRDDRMADVIIVSDEKVNLLQHESEELSVRILATRQPMAQDLRVVVSCLKMASELERIADYAANIAKHISDLDRHLDLDQPVAAISEMVVLVKKMLSDTMAAFANVDVQKAIAAWHHDDQIDLIYAELLSDLQKKMSENSDSVKTYTGLIFIARCCERIGDHITNIVENVHYIKHGKTYINSKVPLS
ncbi:MAG: phosphate signaling complex protein PhoU [Desulfobacterales bacterium]|jgi:phosphate transport system protein